MRASILVVTPYRHTANNGNWQTARRWAAFLRRAHRVEIATEWDGSDFDAMIALHARRSAASIERFARTGRPLAVVLTGTDLYRDICDDRSAQRSLELADRLVVLQPQGLEALAPGLRGKADVIVQSARTLAPLPPRSSTFDLLLVGHLRPEKDPLTALRALGRLPAERAPFDRLRLIHAGADHDPATGAGFRQAAAHDPRVSTLGALPHARARGLIRRGRLLLLPSLIEGGANVLIEAVTSGVPVLASRIGGSVGILGPDYDGYFEPGDDAGLATLIQRCQAEPAFLARLRAQCATIAPMLDPANEAAAVKRLADNLLANESTRAAPAARPSRCTEH